VQKHERRTIASLEDADPAATAGDIEQNPYGAARIYRAVSQRGALAPLS